MPLKIRVGQGFDIHPTKPGNTIVLGGVTIPAPFSLSGHSDADVLLHAITDALLGALGEKDIGYYFPPTEKVNENRSSVDFLNFALAKIKEKGFSLANIDCNILCEEPKILPYREKIIENLSKLMGILPEQISVKGRTLEKLGALGRKEGLAALATVLLVHGA